jgi:hypothetical protein
MLLFAGMAPHCDRLMQQMIAKQWNRVKNGYGHVAARPEEMERNGQRKCHSVITTTLSIWVIWHVSVSLEIGWPDWSLLCPSNKLLK